MNNRVALFLAAVMPTALPTTASMSSSLGLDESLGLAEAVCHGTVLATESFKNPSDGGIYTRARVRVDEVFKGRFPEEITVVQRGGQVGLHGESVGCATRLQTGETRTLFLSRRPDRALTAWPVPAAEPTGQALHELREKAKRISGHGGDVTDQAWVPGGTTISPAGITAASPSSVTNLLADGFGVASRFTAADAGNPIPYLVDADALPSGMTLNQALNAVRQALAAWSGATGVRFVFEGMQSFGTAAANVGAGDGKLRIQLHDLYGFIPEPQVLGKGGRSYRASAPGAGSWGSGGRVAGSEFYRTSEGYVTLKHTDALFANASTFAEVLCHEVGHALSMAHSSENPNESWPDWRQATMYYSVHADGRGATLGAYDIRVIQQALPIANTPPASFDRVMDIVTQGSGAPNIAGINEIEAHGYDRQESSLALETTGSSTPEFTVAGDRIKYAPQGFYSAPRLDPAEPSFYDIIYLRHSDGLNASAYASVRTVSFLPDGTVSDGMPTAWMNAYFGTSSGTGTRAPNADFDGDGVTNLREFILGSDPTRADSNLRITSVSTGQIQFQAKPYEVYEVHGSTNLATWNRVLSPLIPTTATGVATGFSNAAPAFQALRVLKVQ